MATDAELLVIEAEKLQRMSESLTAMRLLFEAAEAECRLLHHTIDEMRKHELEHAPMPGP